MRENTVHFDEGNADRVVMELSTIDNIVEKHKLYPVELLKVDVQGAEVTVLQGASKTLRTVEMVYAEVSILQYNQGTPSFYKLQSLMHSHGFAFYDIGHVLRTNDQRVMQFDATWVKRYSTMWSEECTGFPPPPFYHSKETQALKKRDKAGY